MKNLKNNKGFSLVELIIVIAIMAVLIGILAPQYLKYVEKTRLSADNDYIDSVRKACETVLSDPSYNVTAPTTGNSYTITFSDTAAPTIPNVTAQVDGAAAGTTLADLLDQVVDIDGTDPNENATDTYLTSRTYQNAANAPAIIITMNDDDGDGIAEPRVTTQNVID